jgi:hypothetical protein
MADEVTHNTTKMKSSAKTLDEWGDYLLTEIGKLTQEIKPGTFPKAIDLKTTVDSNTASLKSNVTANGNALKALSANVVSSAKDYDKNEDDNKREAERVNTMNDAVDQALVPEKNK